MSVVIPTYYRSHDLSCLFESLLGQTIKPGEVIAVDDTPNAEIKNLCREFAAIFSRIGVALVYVENCRERSISIARNLGVEMSSGDIILFLDSDVVLHPDCIEKMLAPFSKYPRALAVGGFERAVVDSQSPSGVRWQTFETLKKLFFLIHSSRNNCNNFEYPLEPSHTIYSKSIGGRCCAVKRAVLNEFHFDENLKGYSWMEDFLFSASICKKHPESLLITPDAMYIHTNSAETRLTEKKSVGIKRRNRKYVLMQLWGSKGVLIFGWQNLGILIFKAVAGFRRRILRRGYFGLEGGEE